MANHESHLSRISTLWPLVQQAHGAAQEGIQDAQRALLERYAGAIHRYLLGAARNADAADELFQDFAVRFLRGDFKNADPGRGRFRDYVKTSLIHLVSDYRKKVERLPAALPENLDPTAASSVDSSEREFLLAWREEMMARAWVALEEIEQQSGQPVYTVLRLRADQPKLPSAELAAQAGAKIGRTYSIDAVRQALHRARERYTDLLLDEVVQSLENASSRRLEEELQDLDLLHYCRGALERRSRDR